MRIGLAKVDITPRVGVELCGFGPFLNRHSTSVRDRLWARAMAIEAGGKRAVLVSCDLIGVTRETTDRVRALVRKAAGLPPAAVMVHATHTHSGPSIAGLIGWGDPDWPYLELLPGRIAEACSQALGAMRTATFSYGTAVCPNLGYNREVEPRPPQTQAAMRDEWRPKHTERTDTTVHVLKIESGGRTAGFLSRFSCHPVTCCDHNTQIHGDYPGVAGGVLEKELGDGAVGLFLQGCHGDVNTCIVHKNEEESLRGLEVLSQRYARAVRAGLDAAKPIEVDSISFARRQVTFGRKPWGKGQLRKLLAEQEAVLHAPGASDESHDLRLAMVRAIALRRLLADMDAGRSLEPPTELQGLRLGPIALLGAPLEIFGAIGKDVAARSPFPVPLVLSLVGDGIGYAVDREVAARGGYAADLVPLMCGSLPFADIHGQLVEELLLLAGDLK